MGLFGLSKGKKEKLVDIWPKDVAGETVKPKFLTHLINNDMQDELTVNMLESFGIPCIMKYPGNGGFGKVMLGMSGDGTDIYVPETMYDDAIGLLKGEFDENELS